MSLKVWVQIGRKMGASDLHVEGGSALVVRVGGELRPVGEPVAAAYLARVGQELLRPEGWTQLMARGSADVSVVLAGTRRRINVYRTLRGLALAVRLLAQAALAALIEEINGARTRHVITLESPLEYVFASRRAYIRQRDIPTHSPSFEQAIIDALRENPDVLVISEMRTPEVIHLTLNAAETGHLVLATMHSATSAEALGRICRSFAAEIHGSIRAQLAVRRE